MGKKPNLFQIDLRKERVADCGSWTPDAMMAMRGVEKLLPAGFSLQQQQQQRVARVDSYRAPPLKLTLETIVEEKPPEVSYLRSMSLPVQRSRFSADSNSTGHAALHRLPSYRPGQGDYLGSCGVSMSGPISASSYDYDSGPKHHRSRISKMREALRRGRLRQAFRGFLSRMRPASRGS